MHLLGNLLLGNLVPTPLADAMTSTLTSTDVPFMTTQLSVATLEYIAAEEGVFYDQKALPNAPRSWAALHDTRGWAAPNAESLANALYAFVQDEAATLRRDYFVHATARLAAAQHKIDDSVAHFISSGIRPSPLLPTMSTLNGAPPVIRSVTSQGSMDAACVAV